MSRRNSVGRRAYARRIERALQEARGSPVVLSPRDWALLSDWYDRGVPLAIVLESLDSLTSESSRAGDRLTRRGLASVSRAVDAAWQTVLEGMRTGPTMAPDEPASSSALGAWRRVLDGAANEAGLKDLLETLIRRAEAGEDPGLLDEELDAALAGLCRTERVEQARRDARASLARYRDRMSAAVFAESLARALNDRLRRDLGLPRLSVD